MRLVAPTISTLVLALAGCQATPDLATLPHATLVGTHIDVDGDRVDTFRAIAINGHDVLPITDQPVKLIGHDYTNLLQPGQAVHVEIEGYAVRCAENGAQALALLRGYLPEAIVLDLSMPVMSGWELLEVVHERCDLRGVPVLVLSAMVAPAGVEHLNKPVSLDELLAKLDSMCSA